MSELIRSERDGAVCVLTFNAPERRNTLSLEMRDALYSELREASRNPAVRAIVLTGARGIFSAGGDMRPSGASAALTGVLGSRAKLQALNDVIQVLAAGPKPVVAAVEGVAFGAGLSVALACDYIVAGRSATFCAAFIRVGLVPDCGLLWSLPQRVGLGVARQMMMTGRVVDIAEAGRIGLVDEVTETGDVLEAALKQARIFTEAPTIAVAALKSALARGPGPLADSLARELDLQAFLAGTDDHDEGKAAFVAKRKAEFKGR